MKNPICNLEELTKELNKIQEKSNELGFLHLSWMEVPRLIRAIGSDLEKLNDIKQITQEIN